MAGVLGGVVGGGFAVAAAAAVGEGDGREQQDDHADDRDEVAAGQAGPGAPSRAVDVAVVVGKSGPGLARLWTAVAVTAVAAVVTETHRACAPSAAVAVRAVLCRPHMTVAARTATRVRRYEYISP
ncbi:hypothetical protein Srufu_033530 [Streptomyces libani subsp. rufus]|nr:hypothetical protein Srufu_033530 [Streptomyces libani subsp. rufus]